MNTNLFRKRSLEKISSPEQLNSSIKTIHPQLWLILLGFFIIAAAAGVWMFAVTMPERVALRCISFTEAPNAAGDLSLYAYAPFPVSKRLSENMQVQVSPDYAFREEVGYIYGTITSIGSHLIDEADLTERYGSISFVEGILPQVSDGNFVEVIITPEKQDGNIRWSNPKGNSITLEKGAYCTGIIVTKERKPYELIFN